MALHHALIKNIFQQEVEARALPDPLSSLNKTWQRHASHVTRFAHMVGVSALTQRMFAGDY